MMVLRYPIYFSHSLFNYLFVFFRQSVFSTSLFCEKPRATQGIVACYKRNLFCFFSHITQTGTYERPRCLKCNFIPSYQMILYAYFLFIKFYYFQKVLWENLTTGLVKILHRILKYEIILGDIPVFFLCKCVFNVT